jgi:cell division protein FtsN
MKDYAKILNTPKEARAVQKEQSQEKPNLVRSAKELQPKESGSSKNTFGILLVIFILAIVGYGVVRQYFATHHIDLSSGTVTKQVAQVKKSVSSTAGQNSVPQFDFYTVLPKGTQPSAPTVANAASSTASAAISNPASTTAAPPAPSGAPDVSSAPAAPAPSSAVQPSTAAAPVSTINVNSNANNNTSSNTSTYYLSAGDYNSNDDAQKMLSQLLLLGAAASVTTKTINGATAYEVLVGPFSDPDTMNVVKNQLSSHQINTEVAQ